MVQYLKGEVRERLLDAALREFASQGFEGARMSDIAARAGISSGNIYRYYKNKDDLFYAAVDRKFAAAFLKLVRRRVRSLDLADGLRALDSAAAQELLDFWIAHRLETVIILSRMKGCEYEAFADKVVHELTRLALRQQDLAGSRIDRKDATFLLDIIFSNTVRVIVTILAGHEDEATIRRLFATFWRYQVAGLQEIAAV